MVANRHSLRAWRGTRAAILVWARQARRRVTESSSCSPLGWWRPRHKTHQRSPQDSGAAFGGRGRGELTAPRAIVRWSPERPMFCHRCHLRARDRKANTSLIILLSWAPSSSLMQPISVTTVTIGLLGGYGRRAVPAGGFVGLLTASRSIHPRPPALADLLIEPGAVDRCG
jgi:hypothetical protein